jgi:hypothetical protein
MKPDRYEPSPDGCRRLSGNVQRRGSKMGIPTGVGFLFGSLFVAVGIYISLMGTKVVSVNPAAMHAPYWVLTVAGVSFALGGMMVWGMAGRQFAADRRRIHATLRHPNEPALTDYPWHPDGFEVSEWPAVAKLTAFAIGLTVFLSMFNWWAFVAHGPWMVKGIVILFDCVALAMWLEAARQLGRAFKFGHSRIVFTGFPYRLTAPVILHWQPAAGVAQIRKGDFTLRCVKEWMESTGTGKNRQTSIVHEELWSGKWVVDQPRKLELKDSVELRYELPADAQPTQLSADTPIFWELEVKLDLPGLDFQETYLVPIYSPKTSPRIAPILLNR